MTAAVASLVCSNEACEYTSTRKCVEGNLVEECPHLGAADGPTDLVGENVESTTRDNDTGVSSLFRFRDAEPLSPGAASALLKTKSAAIVALVGQAEAGKTSLIAEVYDAFQYGSYDSLFFAGSDTLIAFEKICHKARGTSKGLDLYQERTDVTSDPKFYHLVVANEESGVRDILIADRSGETYRDILDKPSLASECLELRRATVLNLLVDGARLCASTERANVVTECHQVMQTLIYSSLIARRMRINVILTKLDFVDASPDRERVHTDFKGIVERVRSIRIDLQLDLGVYKVAARPHNELYKKGYGVEPLLHDWLGRVATIAEYPRSSIYEDYRAIEMLRSTVQTP